MTIKGQRFHGLNNHPVSREWKSLAILQKVDRLLKKKIGTFKDQALPSFRIGLEFQLCPKTISPFETYGQFPPQCILESSKCHYVSCLQLLLLHFFLEILFSIIFSEKLVTCTEKHFICSLCILLQQFPDRNHFHRSAEIRLLFLEFILKKRE